MLGLRAANATRCREGLALRLRKPAAPADRWTQGDGEGGSWSARGDGIGMLGRTGGCIMQESVG